jgi:hypothetical protein
VIRGLALTALTAIVAAGAACGGPDVDCDGGRFDTAAWKASRSGVRFDRDTKAERTRRRLAQEVVACGLVKGASEREVLRLLGPPERQGPAVRHPRYSLMVYLAGYRDTNDTSDVEEFLYVLLSPAGKVVFAEAPDERDGDNDTITTGEPLD